jgi:hypothetical protein
VRPCIARIDACTYKTRSQRSAGVMPGTGFEQARKTPRRLTAQTSSPLKLLLQGDRGEVAIWTSHSLRRDPLNGHWRVNLAGGERAAEVKFP